MRKSERAKNTVSQLESAETVSGQWLVKAILVALVAAGLALYFAICLLFYQGQWQFVFSRHSAAASIETSSAIAAKLASSTGLPIHDVRFDYTEEGTPRLDGWWIPANGNSNLQGSPVVLFFSDGRSTLLENIDAFRAFHAMGVSIFAFDYRGLGASQSGHPSQKKVYEDGLAAFRHLTGMLHIDPHHIVFYGTGVGSAVAAHTAQQSQGIAGIVLENPQPSLAKQVKREQHIHLLPMWLVFTQRFDISRIVPALKMPKLVIATNAKPEYPTGAAAIYNQAVTPKQTVQINVGNNLLYQQLAWQQAMQNFLSSIR